jgi:hypothetical protein
METLSRFHKYNERRNWKVNGMLIVGQLYVPAKDSSNLYEFRGMDPENKDLYVFENITAHALAHYTELGLDQMQFKEVE